MGVAAVSSGVCDSGRNVHGWGEVLKPFWKWWLNVDSQSTVIKYGYWPSNSPKQEISTNHLTNCTFKVMFMLLGHVHRPFRHFKAEVLHNNVYYIFKYQRKSLIRLHRGLISTPVQRLWNELASQLRAGAYYLTSVAECTKPSINVPKSRL